MSPRNSDEDPLEVRLVTDAVMQEEFEPCPNMLPHANGKVLNDEIVIIHACGPMGEPKIFEPNAWVGLPSVFDDVGGRPELLREWCSSDTPTEGPWPRALGLGLRSPLPSMVWPGPEPPTAVRWISLSRWA